MLREKRWRTPVPVEGRTPLRPYYTPRDRAGNPVNILKVKPKTDMGKCSGCGVCANMCPMGSIEHAHPEIVRGICIKCCACQKKCPTGAKYFDDPGYLYHKEELELGYARRRSRLPLYDTKQKGSLCKTKFLSRVRVSTI